MKIEQYSLIHVLGLSLLLNARAGTASVVARDTDKVSDLRAKLSRLSNLLSYLDDVDENDLQKVADKKTPGGPSVKTAVTSEDMEVERQKQRESTPTLAPVVEKPAGIKQNHNGMLSQDSSIQILAKALARLNDPNFKNADSTGEYLGAENNEPVSDSRNTQDMENIIARALTRLSQDRKDDTQSRQALNPVGRPQDKHYGLTGLDSVKQIEDGTGLNLSQEPTREDLQIKDEAIRVVETRLMNDVLLAKKLDISLEDLIQDLDDKARREEKQELEDKLNALSLHKK